MRIVLTDVQLRYGRLEIDASESLALLIAAALGGTLTVRGEGREEPPMVAPDYKPAPEPDPREAFVDAGLGWGPFVHFIETWIDWLREPSAEHPWTELLTTTEGVDFRRYVEACGGLRSAVLGYLHTRDFGSNATNPDQDRELKQQADHIAGNIVLATNYAGTVEGGGWLRSVLEPVPLSGVPSIPDVYPGQIPPSPCLGSDDPDMGVSGCPGATCAKGVWTICETCPAVSVEFGEGTAAVRLTPAGRFAPVVNPYHPESAHAARFDAGVRKMRRLLFSSPDYTHDDEVSDG